MDHCAASLAFGLRYCAKAFGWAAACFTRVDMVVACSRPVAIGSPKSFGLCFDNACIDREPGHLGVVRGCCVPVVDKGNIGL